MPTPEDERCLETKQECYRRQRYNDMYVERAVILSNAFRVLTATAMRVYLIFLTKRQVQPILGKRGRTGGKRRYVLANQGQIRFTYIEAKERHGISDSAFRDAIDLLVTAGWIDIAATGSGLQGDKTLYAVSERWRAYGTVEFVVKARPKRTGHYGFTKGNRLGRCAK